MLKETEEIIVFVVTFLPMVTFQLGGGGRSLWAHALSVAQKLNGLQQISSGRVVYPSPTEILEPKVKKKNV